MKSLRQKQIGLLCKVSAILAVYTGLYCIAALYFEIGLVSLAAGVVLIHRTESGWAE